MSRRRILSISLKIGVSLVALFLVRREIMKDSNSLEEIFNSLDGNSLLLILTTLFLLILNQGLEAQKWRVLLRPFYPDLSLSKALKAVFAGMTAGIFTPNRVGEYAGRVLYLKPGRRLEAIVLTFINRLAQMLITLIMGLLTFALLLGENKEALIERIFGTAATLNLFLIGALLILGLVIAIGLFPHKMLQLLPQKWRNNRWLRKASFALRHVEGALIRKVVLLAFLRYLVFSTQYFLLLLAFDYQGPVLTGYAMIFLVFLGKSLFPYVGLGEIGIREWVAIQVMGIWGFGAVQAFQATLLLYFINILLPVLLGIIFLQGIKVESEQQEAGA